MKVIGLHGPSGIGKDTFVNRHIEELDCQVIHMKFALPLRAIVYALEGWDIEKALDKGWENSNGVTDKLIAFNDEYKRVCPDLMVNGADSFISRNNDFHRQVTTLVMFSDVRQPNEYYYLKYAHQARLFKLWRANYDKSKTRRLDNKLSCCPMPEINCSQSLSWADVRHESYGTASLIFQVGAVRLIRQLTSFSTQECGGLLLKVNQNMTKYFYLLNPHLIQD